MAGEKGGWCGRFYSQVIPLGFGNWGVYTGLFCNACEILVVLFHFAAEEEPRFCPLCAHPRQPVPGDLFESLKAAFFMDEQGQFRYFRGSIIYARSVSQYLEDSV